MNYVLGADISHYNQPLCLESAKLAGLGFLFHKATQGLLYVDPYFSDRRNGCSDLNIPFGAYHFATGDNPKAQVEHFLSVAKGVPVLALDFEKNTGGRSMSLSQAEDFCEILENETDARVIVYTGSWLKDMHRGDTSLTGYPLWLAQYGQPVLPLGFTKWSFLQFTDGHVGPDYLPDIYDGHTPRAIEGIGHCDIDLFNGAAEELAAFWAGK